jgi:hypothetical protein
MARVHVLCQVVDVDGREAGELTDTREMHLGGYPAVGSQYLNYVELLPGRYRVGLLARSEASQALGRAQFEVTVPSWQGDRVSVGGLVLTAPEYVVADEGPLHLVLDARNPPPKRAEDGSETLRCGGLRYAPSPRAVFYPGDTLVAYTEVYGMISGERADPKTIPFTLRSYGAGKMISLPFHPEFPAPTLRVKSRDRLGFVAVLLVPQLDPGDYTLQMTVFRPGDQGWASALGRFTLAAHRQ